jgi:hypothetical protein
VSKKVVDIITGKSKLKKKLQEKREERTKKK